MIKYFALKWKYFHLITKLFLFKILQPLTGGNSLSLKFELEFPAQLALHFIIITESSDLVEYQNKSPLNIDFYKMFLVANSNSSNYSS